MSPTVSLKMRFYWESGIKVVALLSLLCAIEAAPGNTGISSAAATPFVIESRIIGGDEADISDFPYLVQLRVGQNLCGGTLVTANWVLTAAHCVYGKKAEDILVIGGSSYLNGYGGTLSTVSLIEVSPYYSTYSKDMDAALLKLKKPLSGANMSTVPLASSTPRTGSIVSVAGWGLTTEDGSVSSVLQSVELKVADRAQCARSYRRINMITENMICASGDYKDSCQGDSGGGVFQNSKLVGIVSFGQGCARPGYPGVYTDVSKILDWIKKIISKY